MSYRDNWLEHLLAPLTGRGLSNALARDFWSAREDLWDPRAAIKKRWLKLLWVYSMSVITQVTLPCILIALLVRIFKELPLRWWLIGIGGPSALAIVFAVLVATATCIDINRRARSGRV
jgi:hypothetical protein